MARQRAPKKRVPKQEKELKQVFGKLKEIIVDGGLGSATLKDLHYARLLYEGMEQTEAYQQSHKPTTDNMNSLYSMASRTARKESVLREMDRLRRAEEEEANRRDSLEDILLDGPRMKMEMLKVIYLMATNPEVQDAVRLKAAMELGNLKHVDAFCRSSTVIDNSKTQNNYVGQISLDTNNPAELRSSLHSAISGYLGEPAPALSTAKGIIEAEVVEG